MQSKLWDRVVNADIMTFSLAKSIEIFKEY